jgi:hypothetical protein
VHQAVAEPSETPAESLGGRVAELWVYPLKGARGTPLPAATLGPWGLAQDRRWMLVRPDGRFLTQREEPRLARLVPRLEADHLAIEAGGVRLELPLDDRGAPLAVTVWRDRVQAVAPDPAADSALSAFLGREVRLVRFPDRALRPCDPGVAPPGSATAFADGFPLLVTSEGSLAELNAAILAAGGTAVPMGRFRPNLVLADLPARAEDRAGRLELGGGAALLLVKPCARCVVTTTDQETGERRGPEPIRTLQRIRGGGGEGVPFGQNAVPVLPAGPVRLERGQEARLAGAAPAATS